MRKLILLPLLIILTLFSGCETTPKKEQNFITSVEQAHKKDDFLKQEAVQFRLQLSFGGQERLNGTLSLLTNSTKGRIDYEDGRCLIYDNGKVYYTPEFTEAQANFAAYTWSYFFLLPYKISDTGTKLLDVDEHNLKRIQHNTKKLVFTSETGASPDDWYILYADTATHLLHAAAYIVTANKSPEEAEQDPHAIEYLNYEQMKGVPIATTWKFWGWQPKNGFTNQLGEATLSEFGFYNAKDIDFTLKENMLEVMSF